MEFSAVFTPTLPTFFTMFLFIYLSARFFIFRTWNPKHIPEASSCVISLSHSTPVVFMSIHALLLLLHTPKTSPLLFASKNSPFANTILEYSIAYFLVDLLHYMVFFPTRFLFILHHLATLYVFLTCRYVVHHGANAIIVLLLLAEITSGCQNAWTLAGIRRGDSPAAAKLYKLLSPWFYGFYSVARVLLGPMFMVKMGMFYASGAAGEEVLMWAWSSWMVVIVTAICVSIFWVRKHWKAWYRAKVEDKEN